MRGELVKFSQKRQYCSEASFKKILLATSASTINGMGGALGVIKTQMFFAKSLTLAKSNQTAAPLSAK